MSSKLNIPNPPFDIVPITPKELKRSSFEITQFASSDLCLLTPERSVIALTQDGNYYYLTMENPFIHVYHISHQWKYNYYLGKYNILFDGLLFTIKKIDISPASASATHTVTTTEFPQSVITNIRI